MACALQVLDFSQEKHELIHRKVHIIAIIVLVEQHGDAIDVDRLAGVTAYPFEDLHRWLVDPHAEVLRVVHVEGEVVYLVKPKVRTVEPRRTKAARE